MLRLLERFDADSLFFVLLLVVLPAFVATLAAIVAIVALLCGWQPWLH